MARRNHSKKHRRASRTGTPLAIMSSGLLIAAALFFQGSMQVEAPPSEEENTRIVAEFDTVTLPVPVHFVQAGTLVSEIEFENIAFPAHQIPAGSVRDVSMFMASRVRTALPAKVPIFAENLNLAGTHGNAVIDRIPEGMRAITVRVDATTVVEGWAGSGAIVDVLLVEDERTTVVAEQVTILSVGSSVQPVAGDSAPEVAGTSTLLVSQQQALAINTALPRGRITFALRGFQDQNGWSDRIFTSERFLRGETTSRVADVRGFVTIKKGKSFALSDGRWIKTEKKPQGFFVHKPEVG